VVLLLSLALSLGCVTRSQAAPTWTVCASGCDYSTIKAAIAAPTTRDGDTLAIGAGTYTEPGIVVNKSLIVQGEDADTTIVQAAEALNTAPDRVFTIPSGVTVTLQALTIRYGNCAVCSHGRFLVNGGGGLANYGTLTLANSRVGDNTVTTVTSHIGEYGAAGGGIYNEGLLTVIYTTVHGNSATGLGVGGGLVNYGTLTLTTSTVRGNSSDSTGGGVHNSGTLTVTGSTIRGNTATLPGHGTVGGAGFSNYGTATLTNTAISDNGGSGIQNGGTLTVMASTISGNSVSNLYHHGGGLSNTGKATLSHSTISGNSVEAMGGGLSNEGGGTLTLIASTISGNAAASGGGLENAYGKVTITDSIVAKNLHGGDCSNYSGSIISKGYNLDSDGSCQLTAPTDRPGVDPLLGPLQDNDGPTLTHALLPGSPALDAIPWGLNGCGTTLFSDQRWKARPQPAGGACDIGAYEVEVAGQVLSAWVTGVTPHTAVCENATTGQAVTLNDPAIPWDCEAAGLGVTAGDQVALQVRGAVVGMAPRGGGCTNRTTGQQVTFQHMKGATAASCVAAGLVVHPGDSVQMRVQGVAE